MYSYISIKTFQMLRTSYSHERERKNIGLFFNDYIYDKNKTMILRPLCIAARMENGEHASLTHCHSFQDFFKRNFSGIFSDFFSFRGTFLSSSLFSRLLHLARRCSLTALFLSPRLFESNRIESAVHSHSQKVPLAIDDWIFKYISKRLLVSSRLV